MCQSALSPLTHSRERNGHEEALGIGAGSMPGSMWTDRMCGQFGKRIQRIWERFQLIGSRERIVRIDGIDEQIRRFRLDKRHQRIEQRDERC